MVTSDGIRNDLTSISNQAKIPKQRHEKALDYLPSVLQTNRSPWSSDTAASTYKPLNLLHPSQNSATNQSDPVAAW